MNPNNVNHFASAAVGVNRKRSKFNRNSKVLTSMNCGFLYPLYVDEVLPGDNFKVKANAVIRMPTPPKVPVMDNAYLDVYAFFVPNRLVWDHWKEFMGEVVGGYWTNQTQYQVPQISFTSSRATPSGSNANVVSGGDILSYLGVPRLQGLNGSISVSALPVRAYCKICNDWFWDENVQLPINIDTGDLTVNYSYNGNIVANAYVANATTGGDLFPVNKFKDYFTSCLPAPQRGGTVSFPFLSSVPVVTGNIRTISPSLTNQYTPIHYSFLNFANPNALYTNTGNYMGTSTYSSSTSVTGGAGVATTQSGSSNPPAYLVPDNLWADMSTATAITVNQLRMAFQTQKYLETLARGGSRYIEQLYSLFGVSASDKTLQRSQYLGGKRFPIQMAQVAQTSATVSGQTPQANVSAFSLTGFANEVLANSFFEEHGYFMIVGCIRVDNSYSQGIEKMWFRKDRLDYYAPVFANLGEQPVYNKEIFVTGNSASDDGVFGYQEAWAEYRYKPNKLTSAFYNDYSLTNAFSMWNYSQRFTSLPVLSSAFLQADETTIGQTMAQSDIQFIVDLYVENESVRVMPMYSVPGLIDHA